ncbi:MAG: hypothetical protein ACPLX7_10420, partial [Candidatus Kapaibacteriota bacterium]
EKVFVVRSRESIGQCLDDENKWTGGAFTSEMNARLEALISEAIAYVWRYMSEAERANPSDDMIWLLANVTVMNLLKRRGSEEWVAFREFVEKEIERLVEKAPSVVGIYDTTSFEWFSRW